MAIHNSSRVKYTFSKLTSKSVSVEYRQNISFFLIRYDNQLFYLTRKQLDKLIIKWSFLRESENNSVFSENQKTIQLNSLIKELQRYTLFNLEEIID